MWYKCHLERCPQERAAGSITHTANVDFGSKARQGLDCRPNCSVTPTFPTPTSIFLLLCPALCSMGLTSGVHALWLPAGQCEAMTKDREEKRTEYLFPALFLLWGVISGSGHVTPRLQLWQAAPVCSVDPALAELRCPHASPALSGLELVTASCSPASLWGLSSLDHTLNVPECRPFIEDP